MPPPTCIIIPFHAKVVNPTSTPSHHSRSPGYDRHILPFVDVEAKECIEQVNEKKGGGDEDDRSVYKACMHGSTLTTLNVLAHYFVDIDVCE